MTMGIAGIPAHEQQRIRRDIQQFLPENAELWRNVSSRTATGGTTVAPARLNQGPGRLGPMGIEAETKWLDRLGTSRGWWVTVYEDRDVRVNDAFRIGGRRFEVIGFDQDRSYPLTQRVATREVSL